MEIGSADTRGTKPDPNPVPDGFREFHDLHRAVRTANRPH